jgi:hypothetical protein
VRRGKRHDVRCRCVGRRCLAFDIRHPNLFGQLRSSCQISVQQDYEILKKLKHLRFVLKKIDLGKLAEVINETNIIFIFSNGGTSRTPCFREYDF